MRASTLILFLIAIPSASATCSGEECAQEGSDHSELMQRHAVAKAVPKTAKSTMMQTTASAKEIDDMLQRLKNMKVGANGKLPPSEQAHVETIQTLVRDQLIPTLQATRDDADHEKDVLLAAIQACNDNTIAEQHHVATTTAASVDSTRHLHADCRAAEDILFGAKNERCEDLEQFVSGITANPSGVNLPVAAAAGGVPDAAAMGHYLQVMENYFCGKHPIWVNKNTACEDATAALDNKTALCDQEQTQFESSFCIWRVELQDVCANYDSCYDAAVAAYSARRAEVTDVLVPQWITEWTGLHKIQCYVDIWMSDNDVSSVDQPKLQECDNLQVPPEPMMVHYPDAPPMVECDESPVANYPCTEAFVTGEYAHIPHVKQCNAPASCAGGAQVPPPSEPLSPAPGPLYEPPHEAPAPGGDEWGAPAPGGDPWGGPPSPGGDPWGGPPSPGGFPEEPIPGESPFPEEPVYDDVDKPSR